MPERRFTLPPAPPTPALWFGVSVAVNVAFVSALIVFRIHYAQQQPQHTAAYLLDLPGAPRAGAPAAPRAAGPRTDAPPLVAPVTTPTAVAPTPAPVVAVAAPSGDSSGRGGAGDSLAGTRSGSLPRAGLASLGPRYGDGRLWVPPQIGEGWPVDNRPLDMDSIVRRRLLAMADSIQRHPTEDPNRLPSWTFQRNGKTYGLDAQGLHLGSITIPSALLALLPMPQGNIDLARANARLAEMRADIMRAAARADAEDDFRKAVKEIRARNDRERAERLRREHPDTTAVP